MLKFRNKIGYLDCPVKQTPAKTSMKKLLIFGALAATSIAGAQSFEGTIHWSMSMQFTDPAMQAQMAEAQAKMNDPEVQAQMKEMEAKMNDPEMKKMMEQNPQMKAAMENAMKMAKGGGMNSMMPSGMMIRIKGNNSATVMEGGPVDGMEILHRDGEQSVRINRKESTWSKVPEGQAGPEPEMTVTRGTQTAKILGYTCQQYMVQVMAGGQTINQVMWTTTEIKDLNIKSLSRQRNTQGQQLFSDKIAGIPLKMEVTMPQGNMVMEVKEIKREKLSDSDFSVPSGFKEVKFP